MTTDFRALCAELIASWDADGCDWKPQHQARWEATVNRARAALAEPECREPAAVTGQPSDEELALIYHDCCRGCEFMDQVNFENAARAVLTRWGNPAPTPPADGEVAELVAWLRMQGEAQKPGPKSLLSTKTKKEMHANGSRLIRAAELLQRQTMPVPVSERLPGPEVCDAIGCCWWYSASHGWELYHRENGLGTSTHWLPAHALPLPEVNNG